MINVDGFMKEKVRRKVEAYKKMSDSVHRKVLKMIRHTECLRKERMWRVKGIETGFARENRMESKCAQVNVIRVQRCKRHCK